MAGCQVMANRWGGSQAMISAQACSSPAGVTSTTRPPIRPSKRMRAAGDSLIEWVVSGHHVSMPAVNNSKAAAGSRDTWRVLRIGGMTLVDSLMSGPFLPRR